MLTRLIHRSLVGNRELKILAQDLKDEADEPVSKPVEHEAEEALLAIAIVCSFLLVLPSCIPNLRKPAPAPPLPEDFNGATSPENSAQLRIEEFYDDPLLTGLIDQALVGNQELRILNENIQIASNEVLARRGTYLPFLTAGGSLGAEQIQQLHARGSRHPGRPVIAPGSSFPIRCQISS